MLRPDAVPIFVGYDNREAAAYHAFCQSVLEKASLPVLFIPLGPGVVPPDFDGKRDGSNAFIYSRFLIPWLCYFSGWAIFADGDMVCQTDIAELWQMREFSKVGAMVVKHDYQTRFPQKYLGSKNESYPRKNWSSLILWHCGHYPNRILTPEFVAKQAGSFLHRFSWLKDEEIGELPREWNWLVSEYEHNDEARLLHYTIGTPCFEEFANCDHAADWHEVWARASTPT